jgi:outer membrane protein TolC
MRRVRFFFRFDFFVLYLFILLCLSGCHPFRDPSCSGKTAPSYSHFWEPSVLPPLRKAIDTGCEEAVVAYLKQNTNTQLFDLVDVALQNHPATRITWTEARAAAYGIGIANSAFYPSVNVQDSFTYTDTKFPAVESSATSVSSTTSSVNPNANENLILNPEDADIFDPSQQSMAGGGFVGGGGYNKIATSQISVSYLLLDFGGRCATIEAARQALYASNWIHNRRIQDVMVSVLRAYYQYMNAVALLKASREDLENARTNFEAAEQLFEVGLKTKLDVLQAQTDMINTQLIIVDYEGQVKVNFGNLAATMGLPADQTFNVPDFPEDVPLDRVTKGVEALVEIAKMQRPDLEAAYALFQQRQALITIARSAGLPTLSANANFDWAYFFNNPMASNRTYSGSVVLSAPIFNGFLYRYQVHQARENAQAAYEELLNVENRIILEVATSYFDYQTAVKRFKYSEEFLNSSQEAYNVAFASYREGIGTILDLLVTQRALSNARAQRIQARTGWAVALANLAFTTGILGLKCPIQ